MEPPVESGSGAESLGKHRMLLFGALLLVAIVPACLFAWRRTRISGVHPPDPVSPYANSLPGVKYIGDAACARCHANIAATFRRHPMGRSLFPIAEQPEPPGAAAGGRPLFVSNGLEYSIEKRDGRTLHQETRRDASGRVVARTEAEVQFVLGSGRQGMSYVIDRDGYLFESPINWYSQKARWDLSPGFEVINHHFDRPIRPGCLYCHANRAHSVPSSINQYQPPVFAGHAIGCERCHGPGELHASDPVVKGGVDRTIVNPADLEQSLRNAVCEQCHLIGDHRVVRVGRREEDFRPGLPFERFWTVFVQPGDDDENRFVGQVEQMHRSQCFLASEGRLGCVSCHDPHVMPSPEEKTAYYRTRCLECHAKRGCSLAPEVRIERSRDDDCTSCHMPRERDADIPHAASADHRIPRHSRGTERPAGPPKNAAGANRRPVPFHGGPADAQEQMDLGRDLGVALCRSGAEGARMALPLLKAALRARPDDVVGWEALGLALGQLGRDGESLRALEQALTREPNRESTLVAAAYLTANMGQREDSAALWQRAIAVNPWRSDYRAELANVYLYDGRWKEAVAACRETLKLRPTWVEVRKWLVRCYGHLGDTEAARREQEIVLGFGPDEAR
jgi:predicted CXXCH cytochrome family protein